MNVWKMVAAGKLEKTQADPPAAEEGKIRVRVTKLFFGSVDAALFSGAAKQKYPFVPGRIAMGIVTEENSNLLFPKGTRVLLHTYYPEGDTGTAKKDFSESEIRVHGHTGEGYFKDIAYVSPDDMTPLPDSVNDVQALLAHHVGIAKAAVDNLGAQKGQHIAVIGANLLGILICQLLIYQQAAPLLIDADTSRLDFARTCGVYYTLPADDNVLVNVAQITGGRLASGAIYVASASGNSLSLPFTLCARNRTVVISGLTAGDLTADLKVALEKQLDVRFSWDCLDYEETAINLIANHAVNTRTVKENVMSADSAAAFLASYGEHPERDVSEINIVSLV